MVELNEDGLVRAAGGVVWRPGSDLGDGIDVLVVHRERYDDWSLPKGKVEPGETDEECALREVAEETGLECVLGRELPTTQYIDPKGRPKAVRYWAMTVTGGELAPRPGEVDLVRWLPIDDATALLTYAHDRAVVDHVER